MTDTLAVVGLIICCGGPIVLLLGALVVALWRRP